MKTEDLPDYTLTFDDSPEAKDRVYEIMLKWFKKLRHYSGESLGQSDETYVLAPDILAEVAEEGFKFDQKWNA